MAEEVPVAMVPTVGDNGASPPADVVEEAQGDGTAPDVEEAPDETPWEELPWEKVLERRPDWKAAHEEGKVTYAAEKRMEWLGNIQPHLDVITQEHKGRKEALVQAAETWDKVANTLNQAREDGILEQDYLQRLLDRSPKLAQSLAMLAEESVRAQVEQKLGAAQEQIKRDGMNWGTGWLLQGIFTGPRKPMLAKVHEALSKAKDADEWLKIVNTALDDYGESHARRRMTEMKGALTEKQKADERKGQGGDTTATGRSGVSLTPETYRAKLARGETVDPAEIDRMVARAYPLNKR